MWYKRICYLKPWFTKQSKIPKTFEETLATRNSTIGLKLMPPLEGDR